MLYSVNENIFTFNSGTEFAAIQRQRMFNQFELASKIVTRNFNPRFHAEIMKNELDDDDCLNMYDYFQDATHVPQRHAILRESAIVDKYQDHIVGINNNESQLLHHGDRFAKVQIAPGTFGEIGEVQYEDRFGNPTATDVWDSRGFKSKTILYHYDGTVGHEVYYNQAGAPVLEVSHMRVGEQVRASHFKLLGYRGKNLAFASEDDLFAFFLSELNRQVPGIIVNDRPSLVVPVANAEGAIAKYQALHCLHVTDPTRLHDRRAHITPSLVPFFEQYAQHFAGLICPTQAEADDIARLFPQVRTLALPDFVTLSPTLTENREDTMNVICMGRIAEEKHVEQLLRIFALVVQKVPQARLQLMGYFADAQYETEVRALVQKLQLTETVAFIGYLTGAEKQTQLQRAAVLVQTSLGESGNTTLKEGCQYGLPEVAYRIPYGIEDVVAHGENGYLVAPGNLGQFADAIATILNDTTIRAQMRKNALAKAHQYTGQIAYEAWQQLEN